MIVGSIRTAEERRCQMDLLAEVARQGEWLSGRASR